MIAMKSALGPSALIPPGFKVQAASTDTTVTTIAVCSVSPSSNCPICGAASSRVHSRYRRKVADLPLSGRSVRLTVTVRRFWCDAVRCPRRLFAERYRHAGTMGKADRPSRWSCPSSWPCAGRASCCHSCEPVDDAGQQRHVAAGRTTTGLSTDRSSDRDRDRRLGMAAQLAIRNDHLRPRTTSPDRPAA